MKDIAPETSTGIVEIAVLDDDADFRSYMEDVLTAEGGYRVFTFSHPDDLFLHNEQRLPDIVLLDMNMPDLDGFSTFRAIRGMGGLAARTVVTAMTADVIPIQLAKIAAQGLDGCLTKPLSMGELHALLKQHFGD